MAQIRWLGEDARTRAHGAFADWTDADIKNEIDAARQLAPQITHSNVGQPLGAGPQYASSTVDLNKPIDAAEFLILMTQQASALPLDPNLIAAIGAVETAVRNAILSGLTVPIVWDPAAQTVWQAVDTWFQKKGITNASIVFKGTIQPTSYGICALLRNYIGEKIVPPVNLMDVWSGLTLPYDYFNAWLKGPCNVTPIGGTVILAQNVVPGGPLPTTAWPQAQPPPGYAPPPGYTSPGYVPTGYVMPDFGPQPKLPPPAYATTPETVIAAVEQVLSTFGVGVGGLSPIFVSKVTDKFKSCIQCVPKAPDGSVDLAALTAKVQTIIAKTNPDLACDCLPEGAIVPAGTTTTVSKAKTAPTDNTALYVIGAFVLGVAALFTFGGMASAGAGARAENPKQPQPVRYTVKTRYGTWRETTSLAEAYRIARLEAADGWPTSIRRLSDDKVIAAWK